MSLLELCAKGRKSKTAKVVVAIAVEILTPRGFGRIRLQRLKDDSAASVVPFVRDVVDPASMVCTDGSAAYLDLKSLGFEHERKVMLGSDLAAHALMPGVHRVTSLLKRWMLGTHEGSVQPDQLDFYLGEFVFRFNRRTSRSRGKLFDRLMEQAVRAAPVTYDDVALTTSPTSAERPGNSGANRIPLASVQLSEVVHESSGLRYRIGNGRTGPIRRYPEAFRDCPPHLPKRTVVSRDRERLQWVVMHRSAAATMLSTQLCIGPTGSIRLTQLERGSWQDGGARFLA